MTDRIPLRQSLGSFRQTTAEATTEELVRGFIAIFLVLTLIVLVISTPRGPGSSAVVASAKTLAIAVIAFDFGLHKGTPHKDRLTATPLRTQPHE